ncbi:MAG: hypothetical protein Q8O00_05650 [Holophaga sp.]|nr:hypothetical protein [Holophaga sp.]
MHKLTVPLVMLLSLCPGAVHAQVTVHIDIGLPPVPRLVLIQPGIQVVEGFQEEVFFHSGWYWCRRPNGWYRARTARARFDVVEVHRVPRSLVRMPAGHYRNWHREAKAQERRERREDKAERKEERRKDKHDRKNHGREKEDKGHGRRER